MSTSESNPPHPDRTHSTSTPRPLIGHGSMWAGPLMRTDRDRRTVRSDRRVLMATKRNSNQGTQHPWPSEWPSGVYLMVMTGLGAVLLGGASLLGLVGALAKGDTGLVTVAVIMVWLCVPLSLLGFGLHPRGPGRGPKHVYAVTAVNEGGGGGVLVRMVWAVRLTKMWAKATGLVGSLLSLIWLWALVEQGVEFYVPVVWLLVVAGLVFLTVRAMVRRSKLPHPPGLVLTPEGVRLPWRRPFTIPWQQISGLTPMYHRQGYRWLIVINATGVDAPKVFGVTPSRFEAQVNALGVDQGLVLAAMQFYLDSPTMRPELGSELGVQRIRSGEFTLDPTQRRQAADERAAEVLALGRAAGVTPSSQ